MLDDKNPKPRADFSDVVGGSRSSAPSPEVEVRTYTVQRGDSLSKIAKALYGDATKWRVIYEANKDKIKNPDLIHPDQTFVIPDLPSA